MNKMFLVTIAFSTILASCSQKAAPVHSEYKSKIVLGAYNDMSSIPTLDESQLEDLPKLVDLKDEMSPAKNQADRGTCTFFSTIIRFLSSSLCLRSLKRSEDVSCFGAGFGALLTC